MQKMTSDIIVECQYENMQREKERQLTEHSVMILDQMLENEMFPICDKLVEQNHESIEGGISGICDEMVDQSTLEIVRQSLSEQND